MATIGAKVESAFSQLITALNVAGLNVYTGLDNEEKEIAPAAIISAVSAREDFQGGGIWHVTTRLTVKQVAADTTISAADDISGQVFQACIEADMTALGALGGITILDLLLTESEQEQSGDAWQQTVNLEVIAALG